MNVTALRSASSIVTAHPALLIFPFVVSILDFLPTILCFHLLVCMRIQLTFPVAKSLNQVPMHGYTDECVIRKPGEKNYGHGVLGVKGVR